MAQANIQIQVLGGKKSLDNIKNFSKGTAKSLTSLVSKYAIFAAGATALLASIKPAYDLLIGANGRLNATILQSQTAIASNFNVFDKFGNEITDIGDKIASQEGTIRDAIIRLEAETQELVGITSATTTEAFNIVLAEGGKFLGSQLGDYEDTIDASIGLTKGLLATLGTLQIPIQQARQEFRALIQGDLNNPDAALIKALGIDKTAFDRAKSEGRLATFIQEQFAVFEEANKLASNSIEGISSNIQDVFEQVTRAAGESLTEGLVAAFKSVEVLINDNKDSLLAFGETFGFALSEGFEFLQKVFGILKDVLGPSIVQIGVATQQTFDAIGKGFEFVNDAIDDGAIDEGIEIIKNTLRAIVDPLGAVIKGFRVLTGTDLSEAQEDFENVNATIALLTTEVGKLVDDWKAFSALTTNVDEEAQDALIIGTQNLSVELLAAARLTRGLNKAREEGDTEKEEQYLRLLGDQLKSLKANRAAAASIVTFNPEQEAQQQAQLDSYDEQIAKLEELGAIEAEPFDGTTFDTRPLTEYGTAAEQLQEKLEGALRTIENGAGGDVKLFEKSIKEAQEYIQTLTELGQISNEDAIAELQALASNANTTAEQRIAIEKQLTDTIKNQSEERIAQLDAESAQIDANLEANLISSSEAVNQRLTNERERLVEELANAQEELAALQTGIGNEKQIALVAAQIDQLSASLGGLDAEITNAKFEKAAEDRAKAFEKEARAIELAFLQGNISSGEATVQNLENETKKATEELAELNTRIADARAAGASEAAINSLQKEADVLVDTLDQLAIKASDARIADTLAKAEREFTRANQAARRAATQQEIVLQQRINNEELAAEEISIIQAAASREQTQIAIQEAQNRIDLLNSLPAPQNQDEAFDREIQLNTAIQSRYDLELQLLRDVNAENRAANESRIREIDDQIESLQLEFEKTEALAQFKIDAARINIERLQTERDLQESITSLSLAQLDLEKQTSELRLQQLDSAGDLQAALADTENIGRREAELIRRRLQDQGLLNANEEKIAKERLKEIERQQEIELEALAIEQQAEKASLLFKQNQIKLQAELSLAEAKGAAARARQQQREIELEKVKAELIEDPAQRARVLANLQQQEGLQQQSIALADQQVDASQAYLDSLEKQFAVEQELLATQQQVALGQLESDQDTELFDAERNLARIQDAPELESRQELAAARQATESATGTNVRNSTAAERRAAGLDDDDSRTTRRTVTNITNNINAPLTSPTIARSLGI